MILHTSAFDFYTVFAKHRVDRYLFPIATDKISEVNRYKFKQRY